MKGTIYFQIYLYSPLYKFYISSGSTPVLTTKINNTFISEDDFDLNEDHTADLAKGEILCRALFLSVDPITSLYMKYGMRIGETFPGRQVARIVESRNKDFSKGRVNQMKLYFLMSGQIGLVS